jgi:2-oxoglutarate dehydrogenase E2 component (dihydrolipoamide succinyltransferase)
MPTQVVMPQLGEGVLEGTLTRWLKGKGDSIQEYEPLLEINTDKVDTEIPSPQPGILLEILVPEGNIVQVGEVLAWIGEEGESIPETSADIPRKVDISALARPPLEAQTEFPAAAEHTRELGFISPLVSRIAEYHNIDLFQVPGTGQDGRITKKDMLVYIEGHSAGIETSGATGDFKAPISQPQSPMITSRGRISTSDGTDKTAAVEIIPLTPVRRSIAEHMVSSKHTSPHATAITEVDLRRVVAHRQEHKEAYAKNGVRLTFTAYFVAAVVSALKAYPIVNSSWSDTGIIIHKQINIGMATSLGEQGLIVPVIKDADQLSLLGIARVVNDLAERARAKNLQPDEVKGGTITITNHGVTGSLFATPIINQPQCAILGVGALQKRVVVISDQQNGDTLAIRPMAYIGLTFDHRVLDGAVSDYFLAKVVEFLQSWQEPS